MESYNGLKANIDIDFEGLLSNLRMEGTPNRVFHMELFQDQEIQTAIADRFDLWSDLDPGDPHYDKKRHIKIQRFCGFDYVRATLDGMTVVLHKSNTEDTAALKRSGGRTFQDEHTGPIANWEDFEKFEWPDPDNPEATKTLEWYQENLPDDMCIVSGSISHFCEYLTWLMGYETLCYALYDRRDLLSAIAEKLTDIYVRALRQYLDFDRMKIVFASDDMGFKTGLLFSAEDMIEYVLKPHKKIADLSRQAGRLYLLHACGNLSDIIDYLVDEVKIDGKHSFEYTIEDVRDVKSTYGRNISLIGGIDVDYLCRADRIDIRRRVRDTLDICMPGGGYCFAPTHALQDNSPTENVVAMYDTAKRIGVY